MLIPFTARQDAIRTRYTEVGRQIAANRASRPPGFDEAGWRRLRDEGLWSLICDAKEDGMAAAWLDFTAALDGLACTLRAPALLLSAIAQAGLVRALQRHGSDFQRRKYMTALAEGKLGATGIAEPTSGTDVRSTRTVLVREGLHYRLSGSKYNIAHAPMAEFTLVVCRHEGDKGAVALVLVDNGAPGVHAGPADDKLGNTDLPTGSLRFDRVIVAADQVLGDPQRGLMQLIDIVSLGRLYYGLLAANIVRPFLDEALNYALQRESFKEPIADHQYVQRRLTDIRIGIERSRWTALGALGQLLAEHPDAVLSCSVAKLVGSDDLIRSAIDLVRLYGSLGYHEGDISRLARDALGFASVGGTEEMHRKNIYNQMTRRVPAAPLAASPAAETAAAAVPVG